MNENNAKNEHSKIDVFVNGIKHELTSDDVKVGTLIKLGGGNIKEYDLEKREGNKGPIIHTYKNPDEVIEVKNGDHFTTHFKGPINPA